MAGGALYIVTTVWILCIVRRIRNAEREQVRDQDGTNERGETKERKKKKTAWTTMSKMRRFPSSIGQHERGVDEDKDRVRRKRVCVRVCIEEKEEKNEKKSREGAKKVG